MANVLESPTTVLASAARTASATSSAFRLPPGTRGFAVQFYATASASTPSVTCTVQHMASDAWTTVLVSSALTGAGLVNLVCHPDSADVANLGENTQVKDVWRIITTASDADSLTYSIKAFPIK